ncbi:MAG: AI-2E family transporter [Patescibacteria group bacterium]
MNERNITVNITTGTILKILLLVLLFVILYLVRDLILVVLLSVVIASAVEPAAIWFKKRKVPRIVGVIVIYFLALFFLGVIFYFIIPIILTEFSQFSSATTLFLEKPSQLSILKELFASLPASISILFQDISSQAAKYVSEFTTGFFHLAAKIFGGALSFILIIILSFYLSVQEKGIENFLRMIIPLKYEEYIIDLWTRSRQKIGRWIQGQILLGVLVGVLTYLGLTILKIDYALTFALLAGLFELIPIFGPVLSAIPPTLLALAQSPILALKVIILFILIQQFENHLIYPLVVRRIVGIPPVLTILALIICGKLAGFLGILLAVPLVTVLVEILNDIDLKKHRTDHSP